MLRPTTLTAIAYLLAVSAADSQGTTACSIQPQPARNIKPSVASGYTWGIAATGLTNPRSIQFDDAGNLWVLESGKGVTKHGVQDKGGACVTTVNHTTVLSDASLNHGIVLDQKRLFVSSSDVAYSVTLDAARTAVVAGSRKDLVKGMDNSDHVTRTLLLVKGQRDILVVSRGSDANNDSNAFDIRSGHATVKAFLTDNPGPVDYTAKGALLGWGLRNDVGMALHPATRELWTVENSMDDIRRNGADVHNANPGEELNNLGVVNLGRLKTPAPKNYGYPDCVAAWRPDLLPDNANLKVGTQFAADAANDAKCKGRQAPRITFEAHSAPLDIKFEPGAKRAWVSFHGSWNAAPPVGYKVGYLEFNGQGKPVEPATSSTAVKVVFANQDLNQCPGACFRPSGLAVDKKGRLWVTSNDSGEIYVIAKTGSPRPGY